MNMLKSSVRMIRVFINCVIGVGQNMTIVVIVVKLIGGHEDNDKAQGGPKIRKICDCLLRMAPMYMLPYLAF